MDHFYVITKKNTIFINNKAHELLKFLKIKYNHCNLDEIETVEFLKSHNTLENKILICVDNIIDQYHINVLNYIKNNEIKSNIFITLIDWWKIPDPGREMQHYFISNVLKPKNYKVIVTANDIDQLNRINNEVFTPYIDNIILNYEMHSAYKEAFIEFNNNPIEKVLISGQTNEMCYPERNIMLSVNNTVHYKYNMNDYNTYNYSIILNNYLCCFSSSVYLFNHNTQKKESIHILLLKSYEILASGSLLILPLAEEEYIKKHGLINNVNCILLDFNKDLNKQVNYILDPNNREYINNIRYNGMIHCKNNFTTENIFNKLHNIICNNIKFELYFLTFANTNYMSVDRIMNQAKSFNMFNHYLGLTEKDIPEFIEKHSNFINTHKSGYGFWIWKPKIILDTLYKMKDSDILIYCDAGGYLNINGIQRLKEYLTILNNSNKSILTFSTSDSYMAHQWVKNDAIMSYYPEFNNELNITNYAGVMIIKKNSKSLELISDWLTLCENYHFLDKSKSINYTELPGFIGNDCDNGLFNLCLAKHKISVSIYPDETNLYSNNIQLIHTNVDYDNIDWSPLDKFPFQNRRIKPKI